SVVSEKDLYETYLEAFRYCIEHAKPAAIMGAYNSVNGKVCCGSKELLVDILRDEFGFDGYVVSDCGAVSDIHSAHKITSSPAESAALAVNNGCQLECGTNFLHLGEAVEQGLITEETITEAVEMLFESRFALGMFDEDCEYNSIPFEVVDCDEHRALNRRMAAKSCVLLKNNGVLPLKGKMNIAVVGPTADDQYVLLGNYNGTPSRYYTLLRGIQEGTDNKVLYARGSDYVTHDPDPWDELPLNEAIIVAKKSDVIILCVGLNPSLEGEENDAFTIDSSKGDKPTLSLHRSQMVLAEEMVRLGKPVIYVNVSGSCVDLSFAKEHADAVIQCFYPGAEGGNALADIIFGKVSPSGRLPVTFYRSVDDLPPFEDYSMENRTYKFFGGETVYQFGDGLTYSEIEENWADDNTVVLTNKGEYDTDYSVLKFEYIPHKSLCDFKTVHLKKGETVTVRF
ncbi:MAG: glycoside hydrolase family 3 C-terminal domain-containing protein, partial [Clostridia bacterium]|nr:glycoside hydrolase family 3 C-terminal domain-containing protein [Clostridia bacterium]